MTRTSGLFITMLVCAMQLAASFTQPVQVARSASAFKAVPATFLAAKKKKSDFDLSSIESRDLTREEMLDINAQNEEVMNMELQAMTVFSLVISLPILYLCWVAFYSD
mmetsp:Transcript_20469/g.31061  ORF Transcript_20469/g.31061 Transcript_20469/m.31061 type:complete len:108 (+) Transcript_20469:72-395(+)|eukprot:CAMPEP_0194075640 /NCGR_PEP_ID=MMETSP0149-20130528/2597_1 /TAXON_ID=122233 /ORGANISM="Chaetoceros debilis, Strain MM31A-1" /LENGTH=107 /DNA_ID=CAMNT_0038756175 /DNA_START=61 /DNA_END=384 /DNA_ORIENTATION=+